MIFSLKLICAEGTAPETGNYSFSYSDVELTYFHAVNFYTGRPVFPGLTNTA
jgi:hypothetical protein